MHALCEFNRNSCTLGNYLLDDFRRFNVFYERQRTNICICLVHSRNYIHHPLLRNYSFKKGSELKQGLYDSLFGAFLVKHIPAEGEVSTGFIGKLEGMASYGDRFTQRQEEKTAKRAAIFDAEK